jgi:hypothetical protein
MTSKNRQGNVLNKNSRRRRLNSGRNASSAALNSSVVRFSHDTETLAQAITNPFDDAAIGAVIPDQWAPPTIPAMDRLTINLEPNLLTQAVPNSIINGFIIALVPRSLSAGWLSEINAGTVDAPVVDAAVNIISVDTNFAAITTFPVVADLYSLFVGSIGFAPGLTGLNCMAYDPDSAQFRVGFNAIPFSRIDALAQSCSGARICGAGLKIFSDEAPIETGGTAYGGWCAIDDIFKLVRAPVTTINSFTHISSKTLSPISELRRNLPGARVILEEKSPGNLYTRRAPRRRRRRPGVDEEPAYSAATFQDALKFRHAFKGIEGVTVRYSPLQSASQEVFQPIFEDALFHLNETSNTDPELVMSINRDVAVGTHDLIGPSDYVPMVVWRFNGTTNADPDLDKTYTLRIEARVHLQCEPDGDCPFMASTITPDPHYTSLQLLLENKDAFPVVTKGSSFKSFLHGMGEALKSGTDWLHFGKDVKTLFL